MAIVLQGSLKRFSVSQVFSLLGQFAHSGTLDVDAAGQKARLWFDGGKIVGGKAAGGAGAREIAIHAIEWADGTFAFSEELDVPQSVRTQPIDVRSVIEEAERRAADRFADDVVVRVVDDPAAQEKITLSPEQFKLLFRIGSGKTVGELVSSGQRDAVKSNLELLESAGLITRDVNAAVVAAPAPAERRAVAIGTLTLESGDMVPLLDAEQSIGRDASNAIVLADASVSSRHARIIRSADGFHIDDLNSRNGTFVNGEKVTARRLLADGDMIRLGKIMLTFRLAQEQHVGETTQTSEARAN